MTSLRWHLPGGVIVACSVAADGDQRQADVRGAWCEQVGVSRALVVPRQVHGALVVETGASAEELAVADGVVSVDGTHAVGAYGADCPGVCIVAGAAIGIAHGGWRGTAAGIVGRLVDRLRLAAPSVSTEGWSALIGPGISGRRYEVDAPVLSSRIWPASSLAPARPGHAHLDLAAAIASDLAAAGIRDIRRSGICTFEDERLWSFRRRGAGQVQVLAAWRE